MNRISGLKVFAFAGWIFWPISKNGNGPIPRIVFALALALLTGCVSDKPLYAVPESQRVNVSLVNVTKGRTRQTGEAAGPAADVSRVLDTIPFPNHSYDWIRTKRHQNGNFECGRVETAIESALGKIHSATGGTPTSTLELEIKSYGIDELQYAWYGPYLCVAAELKDATGKKLWSEQAVSVGTMLHRKAELERNPKLYREEFAEVADDIAHQLIEGPIRQVYFNTQ
jgi:hypothetical protein